MYESVIVVRSKCGSQGHYHTCSECSSVPAYPHESEFSRTLTVYYSFLMCCGSRDCIESTGCSSAPFGSPCPCGHSGDSHYTRWVRASIDPSALPTDVRRADCMTTGSMHDMIDAHSTNEKRAEYLIESSKRHSRTVLPTVIPPPGLTCHREFVCCSCSAPPSGSPSFGSSVSSSYSCTHAPPQDHSGSYG